MIKNISQKAKNKERYPEDWKVLKISDVADVKGGKRLPKGYSLQEKPNGYPYITVSDMYIGGISTENIKYVPEEVVDKIKNYRISTDDLFISVAGTLGIVGKVPESLNNANLTENADKLTNIKIDKEYLYQVLISDIIQKEIEKEKTTNAQPKLALTRIKNFRIPVPSNRNEIKKIALILSTWDKAIELKEKLIEQKKELKKGLMQKLLTREVRLPGYKDEWKIVRLGEIGKTYNGLSGKSTEDFGEGKPYIPYKTIFDDAKIDLNKLDYVEIEAGENQNSAKYGDIFFTTSSETPDEVAMSSVLLDHVNEIYLNSFCFGYRLNNFSVLLPEFAQFLFRSDGFRRKTFSLAQGSTRFNISKNEVMKIEVSLPSIEEQKSIAEILSYSDKEIKLLDKQVEFLKQQKKGLMQLLLTGKVRVQV
jgi:type I restriction enzyme, S subunit